MSVPCILLLGNHFGVVYSYFSRNSENLFEWSQSFETQNFLNIYFFVKVTKSFSKLIIKIYHQGDAQPKQEKQKNFMCKSSFMAFQTFNLQKVFILQHVATVTYITKYWSLFKKKLKQNKYFKIHKNIYLHKKI